MGVLSELKPGHVWAHFERICAIPHPSHHEEGVARYIMEQAARLGFEARRDDVGNVLVVVPATPGFEDRPTVVLQGHMDMVPVAAPGVTHDFEKEPITPYVDGDFVRARGTTLGADNGIGCALALGIMSDADARHGNLELLFTVNEEAGMDGAHGLKADFVTGRMLINLDSEQWGEFCISCAGGGDSVIRLPVERSAAEGMRLDVRVGGLRGGHSGIDIDKGHGNAIKILGRCLAAGRKSADFRLVSIRGGTKRNAIADSASAVVVVPAEKQEALREAVGAMAGVIGEELARTDPGLRIEVAGGEADGAAPMGAQATGRMMDLLVALPQGVVSMSPEMKGLVETSTNVGVVESDDAAVTVVTLTRSAIDSKMAAVKQQIATIARLVGAEVEEPAGYPGWRPNPDSPLLKTAVDVYRRLHGEQPRIWAVHAGLECALFGEKLPGVDMISMGPTMHYVHSPDEELYHPSVAPMYELLRALLEAVQ